MTAPMIVPGPVVLPAPAGPGTRTCCVCGLAHGVIVDYGHGAWIHLNPDRCKP